jgi:hypothetical protein
MSVTQKGGQHSKNPLADQETPKTPQASRSKGLGSLLETVRQKMAYTIRGI